MQHSESFHIHHHSGNYIPGAIHWYGEDYHSFCHALDSTVQRLKSIPLKQDLSISVHIHDKSMMSQELEEWKQAYCTEKTIEYRAEYVLMKKQGLSFLLKGLLLLWISLSLAYVFDHITVMGDYVQMLGRETFYFLGWVILWKPIEMIVFEPWSLKHQLKLIHKLQHTTLSVLPA